MGYTFKKTFSILLPNNESAVAGARYAADLLNNKIKKN